MSDPAQCESSPRLVLASASARRRRILAEAGLDFEVRPASIEERARSGEKPEEMAGRLAREKALDVADSLASGPARPVLGSDTIVVRRDEVLGKPRDSGHAVEMLERLVGGRHEVMTGIALVWSDRRQPPITRVITSAVVMRPATREELVDYVSLGESLDKAGAYALQGEGGRRLVTAVEGSETNVIGLPLEETLELLVAGGCRIGPRA